VSVGVQVAHLGAVFRRFEEFQVGGLRVGQRQVEAVAEFDQRGLVQLLLAVRGHLALARLAHAVALLGVRQDHRGLAAVLRGGGVGGVDLDQVVAAALEAVDLLVRHALGQLFQLLVLAKEVVAVEAAVFGGKGLHLAVHGALAKAHQRAGGVAGKQAVPVAAPDQLDDVPARAAEQLFQLVDDAAIAAHRAVQALQVAVDDPDQVVQLFARASVSALMLSGSSISPSPNTPHTLRPAQSSRLPVRQVAHEARVVDGADGADAHGAGGELPEVRHQPGVRVAGQAARALAGRGDLLPVVHARSASLKRPSRKARA
jgi:hypothetical protein